ncbi:MULTISPECIES: helix-turn-helix domain-containing protein [Burkholderia]|uniref:helix-turn-helix domain-containing protein n=1 Tax=Burkholderia TaxID=32008 RepID=UPI000B79D3C6|nr:MULTISPECIES: helix-turn-helix transcriptional regulator [Burkholderia]OXI95174.1 transcriptional regulator [Burkholderia sp. AU33803]PRD91379.1 XRE family transcriptional regulator [Burkholderia contaminans]RQT22561.1 XRE family transcriptional regulator [Burkholderia cepacia]
MSNFPLRLKQERRRLQMNQAEFGEAGGVRKQAQSNYEQGSRIPDANYLTRLAEIGVDVQYLLTGRTSDPGTLALTGDEELLLAGFRELKLREKRGVLALVAAINGTPMEQPGTGRAADETEDV